jgi:hypothetical protein
MKRKQTDERAITARPKPLFDEIAEPQEDEPGLSVDPEDLGAHFLSEATETSVRRRPDELSLAEAAPTDEALSGPNFDPEQTVWDSTVDMSLQADEEPLEPSAEPGEEPFSSEDDASRDTLDLTQDTIREGSLLDREGEEPGEVQSPVLITDDTRHPHDTDDEDDDDDEQAAERRKP